MLYSAFMPSTPLRSRVSSARLPINAVSDESVLAHLALRVRGMRHRHALTRKELAEASGVSERHLAQLESGTGNISVLLLAKVAGALRVSVADLFRTATSADAELDDIRDVLSRLPIETVRQMRQQLGQQYADILRRRRHRVALIGLRGAGKSTLGQALAKRLQMPFVELDREVEREAGISLNEIFMLYGQGGFRRYERQCLDRVLRDHERVVIAAGGSLVTEPGTYETLLAQCFTVWLSAHPDEHMARVRAQGDLRPMAGNEQAMRDLKRILEARDALYRRADAHIDTSGRGVDACLKKLVEVVKS